MEEMVPEIRFKDFEDNWNKEILGNISKTSIGEFIIKTKQNDNSPYPVFNGGTSYTGFYEDFNNEGNKIIVSGRGANAGFVNIARSRYWAGNSCYSIELFENIDIDFIYFQMKRKEARFTEKQQAANIPSVSKKDVEEFVLELPSYNEQLNVGQFFFNYDSLITLTQQKLDQLKNLKKACLEKIFPKEGETVPEIRFKGFEGPWEWKKLGGIADIVGGGTPSTSIPEYWSGNISWYSPAEIGNKVFVSESQRKITKAGYNHCSANILPPGTVLFTSRAGIGKTAILEKEGCTNQGFQSIIPHKEQLDSYFIYSRTAELKQYGETVGAGSTFVEVSGKQMADMDILIPAILEQQVIGGYFRNLDNLISIIQQKLDQLKNLKKALLDRMFV